MSVRLSFIIVILFFPLMLQGQKVNRVVVDSVSLEPLPKASIFDCRGTFLGVCSDEGRMPLLSRDDFPITVTYLGYDPVTIADAVADTIRMKESAHTLSEIVFSTDKKQVLHLSGYVREYSTLTTYTDTVLLYREKMVDFMVPSVKIKGFKGWLEPRILDSRSYYRFLNSAGMDSVSDQFGAHFSWSDWVGIVDRIEIPPLLQAKKEAVDTVGGKYGRASTWRRSGDDMDIDVDMLADTINRKWVPALYQYLRNDDNPVDVGRFVIKYSFTDIGSTMLLAENISRISFNIETGGRGIKLFRAFRREMPYYVNTYAEIYITDREYISVSEARRMGNALLKQDDVVVRAPDGLPELQESVKEIVRRVNAVDHDALRLEIEPDKKMINKKRKPRDLKRKSKVRQMIESVFQ